MRSHGQGVLTLLLGVVLVGCASTEITNRQVLVLETAAEVAQQIKLKFQERGWIQ